VRRASRRKRRPPCARGSRADHETTEEKPRAKDSRGPRGWSRLRAWLLFGSSRVLPIGRE
jgi:hypothetical protein